MEYPKRGEESVTHVTEIYVAVFPVRFNEDQMAEVILAGFKKDPHLPDASTVRATVETHVKAVPDLVALCDEIIAEQEEVASYRLLKFDKDGIHTLHPDDFRDPFDCKRFCDSFVSAGWGSC